MKILAFGASNSVHSINKKLATYATTFFDNAEVNLLDLNDFEMPIFSVDIEKAHGIPTKAQEFMDILATSDLIIISFAEHNGSYTTAFKNIFDWASRINGKTFLGKPMLLMSTSPGPRGGKSVLDTALGRFPFHDGKILASFSLPEFGKNFSETEGILDETLKQQFLNVIQTVKGTLAV